ncbi:MAG: polysaccharide lyase [Alphaproteobacteria bacterium]|nr:polysaccharide lyase [Alphaproteobacteria bacterium]MDX5368636.1 polysaccharide lyase [Alphaproteobacteria bacterium]MDX5463381.1 polysaccharide lyase [Alphaproteobacteria bacterium]
MGTLVEGAGKPWSVVYGQEIGGRQDAVRYEVRAGDVEDKAYRASRSETAWGDHAPFGSEREYRFSLFIPSEPDWTEAARSNLVMGQIHHGTDGCFVYPPVLQTLGLRDGQYFLYIAAQYRKSGCYPTRGAFERMRIEFDKWYDFHYRIRFSQGDDGYVKLTVNDETVMDYDGPVGFQLGEKQGPRNWHHFLKLGLYRQIDSDAPIWVYYKY